MVEILEESELFRQNVIGIKKQFLSATSVKKMHWQVIDTAVANICFLSANKNIC
jgi:hypothetical protein